MKFVRVIKEEELPVGKSIIVAAKNEEIALFNYKGKYYAVANKCLHKGAPLGEGRIEEGVVICPNHEWRYDLETGGCRQNPELFTKVYPVRVAKGNVWIGIEGDQKPKALGKGPNQMPSDLTAKIDLVQKPINPDEQL